MDSDVAIIGGGPAGATAATLLARAGVSVTLFERERFPREHIGESLLPLSVPVLTRLGVVDEAPMLRKEGAEFHDPRQGKRTRYPFTDGRPLTVSRGAWQVDRPQFDALLLERAAASGADVRLETGIGAVDVSEDVVVLETDAGAHHRTRYVIDASGRQAVFARKQKTVMPRHELGRGAVWVHYSGLSAAAEAELRSTGNIHVVFLPEGWAWIIPLPGRLSVGVVSRREKIGPELLERELGKFEFLQDLVAGCPASPPSMVGNFSYRNTSPHGQRHVCIGDAACFLDPLYSTGVSLAFVHAERVADTLVPALREGREGDPELQAEVSRHMQVGYRRFDDLLWLFYDSPLIHWLIFHPTPDPVLRAGLISLLGGGVWNMDNPFWRLADRMLRTRKTSPFQA